MKQNWRRLGIEELEARYGMDRNVAEHVWENAYRRALRRARQRGVTKDFNVARELYSSVNYQGKQLFDIKVSDTGIDVQIASSYATVDDLSKAFTEDRFKNMAKKYKQVDKLLTQYKRGRISYQTFREKVKKFRDTNLEYQRAGS